MYLVEDDRGEEDSKQVRCSGGSPRRASHDRSSRSSRGNGRELRSKSEGIFSPSISALSCESSERDADLGGSVRTVAVLIPRLLCPYISVQSSATIKEGWVYLIRLGASQGDGRGAGGRRKRGAAAAVVAIDIGRRGRGTTWCLKKSTDSCDLHSRLRFVLVARSTQRD